MELKQQQRRQLPRRKTTGLMRKNNLYARTAVRFKFWYISLPSSAKQQREMAKFKVLWRTWTHDGEVFIFFLNLNATPTNLVPGEFAVFVEVERLEITAK